MVMDMKHALSKPLWSNVTRLPNSTLKYCSIQIEHKFQAASLESTTTDLKRIIRLYCELMRACEQSVWVFFKQSLPLGAEFSLSKGQGSYLRDHVRPQTDHLHMSEADCRLKPQAHSKFGKDCCLRQISGILKISFL